MDLVCVLQGSSAERQQIRTIGTRAAHSAHWSPPSWSDVQRVRLSRKSCMMRVESLYESSATLSSSAMASSNAVRAILQASSGLPSTSYWNTEKFKARPRRMGWVTGNPADAMLDASSYALRAFSAAAFLASSVLNSAM